MSALLDTILNALQLAAFGWRFAIGIVAGCIGAVLVYALGSTGNESALPALIVVAIGIAVGYWWERKFERRKQDSSHMSR